MKKTTLHNTLSLKNITFFFKIRRLLPKSILSSILFMISISGNGQTTTFRAKVTPTVYGSSCGTLFSGSTAGTGNYKETVFGSFTFNVSGNPGAITLCTGIEITLCGSDIAGSSGSPSGTITYNWTGGSCTGSCTGQTLNITPPLGTSIYTLTEEDGAGNSSTASIAVTILPIPKADVGQNKIISICPNCTSCVDNQNTQIGAAPVGMDTYTWTSNPSLMFDFRRSNPIVTPTSTTTFYLTESNGVCSNYPPNTVVVEIGTNTTRIGDDPTAMPPKTGFGWTGISYNCNDPSYDIEITGNYSTTAYNFQEKYTPSKNPYFIITSTNSTSAQYTSPTTGGTYYTIHSVTVDGGITETLTGSCNEPIVVAAATTSTSVTFDGFNASGGIYAWANPITFPLTSTNIAPIKLIAAGTNNIFGTINIGANISNTTIANGTSGFVPAELDGTFNFTPDAQVIIQYGSELFLNGQNTAGAGGTNLKCTLQNVSTASGWAGIKIDASSSSTFEPTVSQVRTNTWPDAPSPVVLTSQGQKGAQGNGVLYSNSATISNATNSPDNYGVEVGCQQCNLDVISGNYKNGGAAVIIAENTIFHNCSVNFAGPGNEGFQNISYFDHCTFENNSPVRLFKINFTPVLYGPGITNGTFRNQCSFSGIPTSSGAHNGPYPPSAAILSNSSQFSVMDHNSFFDAPYCIYLTDDKDGVYEYISGNNTFEGSLAGIYASGCKNLYVQNNNTFIMPRNGTIDGIGIYLSGCNSYHINYNTFKGYKDAKVEIGMEVVNSNNPQSYTANWISFNKFLSLSHGAENYQNNSRVQYLCNTFSNNFNDINVINGELDGNQGLFNKPAGDMFSENSTNCDCPINFYQYNGCSKLIYWSLHPFLSPYNDYPKWKSSSVNVNTVTSGVTEDCIPPELFISSISPHIPQQQIQNANEEIDGLPLPGSHNDSVQRNYLTGEIQTLVPEVVMAYAMDSMITDSQATDSSIHFLQSQNTYQAIEMETGIYVSHSDSLHTANMLTQIQDSIIAHPSDTEIVNFKNYYSMYMPGELSNWPDTTVHNDSTAMQAIAHSASSVAGNAQVWLQYYCEDLPLAQSEIATYDSVFSDYQYEYTSSTQDSITFQITYPIVRSWVDSTVYFSAVPPYEEYIPGAPSATVMHSIKDSAILTTYHPGSRYYYDSIVIPVNHHATDSLQDSVTLMIRHTVSDSLLYSRTRAFRDCNSVPVTDSIVASNHDSLAYYASKYINYTPTFYTNHHVTDTSVNYATHYSADTLTDSIVYYTKFYSSLSPNSLYDTSLFYRLNYTKDSTNDSTTYHSRVYMIGGPGGIKDSVVYHTVYYTIDSTADTTIYFTNYFQTTYSAESWKYLPETTTPFSWVNLFPFMMASDTDSGGLGMVMPHTLATIDSNLKITIAPNPFVSVLHVNFENMGDNEYNGILRVINALGVEVQSQPVDMIPDFSGEFDIDLSRVSKGFYYIVIQDNNNILYKNGFIKQ